MCTRQLFNDDDIASNRTVMKCSIQRGRMTRDPLEFFLISDELHFDESELLQTNICNACSSNQTLDLQRQVEIECEVGTFNLYPLRTLAATTGDTSEIFRKELREYNRH